MKMNKSYFREKSSVEIHIIYVVDFGNSSWAPKTID